MARTLKKKQNKKQRESRWNKIGVIATVLGTLVAVCGLWYASHPPVPQPAFFAEVKLVKTIAVGEEPGFLVTLTNKGQGTAHDVTTHFGVLGTPDTSDDVLREQVDRPPSQQEVESRRPTVTNGESIWHVLPWLLPLTPDRVEMINREQYFIFVFGYVKYTDDGGKSHILRYCTVYNPVERLMSTWRSFNTLD